jgi:hypothetical protein
MIKKLMIVPYFGILPEWFDQWVANMELLKPLGYDYLLVTNLRLFEQRVRDKLGIEPNITPGTGKVWDYRCAFGVLFEEEIKGYDFWGHTDFDVVYGNVDKWVTDEFLSELDVHSNHNTYVCGPWTLYRNKKEVNELFYNSPSWQRIMTEKEATGWVEMEFSRTLESSGLRYEYTFWQGKDPNIYQNLTYNKGLFDEDEEIMMFHFNRHKIFPLKRNEF